MTLAEATKVEAVTILLLYTVQAVEALAQDTGPVPGTRSKRSRLWHWWQRGWQGFGSVS